MQSDILPPYSEADVRLTWALFTNAVMNYLAWVLWHPFGGDLASCAETNS